MKNLDIDFFQMISVGPTMGLYLGGTHRRMTLLIGKRAERHTFILALKVILLDRLQGIICSGIQEPYLLGVML